MPVGWFFAPYKRRTVAGRPGMYCAMDDFTAQIWADNGFPQGNVAGSPQFWSEAECLGGYAVVKVRAATATLNAIAATPGFERIQLELLDDSFATLTAAQRNRFRDFVVNTLGYPLAELQADLGTDLSTVTLRRGLTFSLKRRLLARYDSAADQIILDGPVQPTRPVESVDQTVP